MKIIGIVTASITIVFLVFIIFLEISFRSVLQKVPITLSKETIYLKQLSGSSWDESVISKKSYTAAKPDTSKEYVIWRTRCFFYKVKDDSLIIYGGDWCNSSKNLITNIRFVNIEDSVIFYEKNYKKLGLNVFPPSEEKFLKDY